MQRLVLLFLVIFLSSTVIAQEEIPSPSPSPTSSPELLVPNAPPPEPTELRVAVAGSAPFVIPVGKDLEGLSVETWRALAGELDVDYELFHLDSVEALLRGVQSGDYDVGIGPISITSERATFVAFTQPYYDSSLGILSLTKPLQARQRVDADIPQLIVGFIVLITILTLVGAVCWFFERRANSEQFPENNPAAGIGAGMWMALVTMTTVGYGDKAPVTLGGRVFTGLWMLITTVTLSSFTAFLATTFTVSQLEDSSISDASQLADKRVAVVGGTTSEVFGRHFTSQLVKHSNYKESLKALEAGLVDAVVYDYPVLAYHVRNNPEIPLRLAESTFALQDYGFVLARNNKDVHRFNVGLLRLAESGVMREIRRHWIQTASDAIGAE